MNEPRVAAFWELSGSREEHAAYLERLRTDAHILPLIGRFDGEPFGYFEAYWAKEDRIAPFYDAGDYDRGLHMLVGEARFRGPERVAAWLSSLAHYLFLDDPRTEHVVSEPRADNARMIDYLASRGFYKAKCFDFPHKRAAMMVLPRESFFSEFCP
jgi:RimJ/RimL family protein N-acetyltransferase